MSEHLPMMIRDMSRRRERKLSDEISYGESNTPDEGQTFELLESEYRMIQSTLADADDKIISYARKIASEVNYNALEARLNKLFQMAIHQRSPIKIGEVVVTKRGKYIVRLIRHHWVRDAWRYCCDSIAKDGTVKKDKYNEEVGREFTLDAILSHMPLPDFLKQLEIESVSSSKEGNNNG